MSFMWVEDFIKNLRSLLKIPLPYKLSWGYNMVPDRAVYLSEFWKEISEVVSPGMEPDMNIEQSGMAPSYVGSNGKIKNLFRDLFLPWAESSVDGAIRSMQYRMKEER